MHYLGVCAFPPQIRVPRLPTGVQVTRRFQTAIAIHYQLVSVFHPSPRKRKQRRQGDIAKKLSTIYTEVRVMRPYIVRAKKMYKYLYFCQFIRRAQQLHRDGVLRERTNAIKTNLGNLHLLVYNLHLVT